MNVKNCLIVLLSYYLIGVALPVAQAQDADAAEILAAARLNPLGTPIALEARLRKGSESVPFRIVVEDGKVSYEFSGRTIILEPKENEISLSERIGGKTAPVRSARFDEKIQGTDISYEDIALRFLYWRDAKVTGTDTINTRKCWVLEIQAYGGSTQYGVVRVWIDQASGALMRMDGFNRDGKLIRRFSVVSAQPIDGQWMLKQMRVESFAPETRKTTSRTYLEVLGKVLRSEK